MRAAIATVPQGADASEQFARGERLAEIIVGARIQAFDAVIFVMQRREDQHRRRDALLAEITHDRGAELLRQHAVQHDDIEDAVEREMFANLAVAGEFDLVIVIAQRRTQVLSHLRIVFDQ